MTSLIQSGPVSLAFKAIACGVRLPRYTMVAKFNQWNDLIDLVRRLEINVFLDVGANRGDFSKHLRMSGYSGHLISFEPIPEEQERIRSLAVNDPNWTACDYALGAESGSKEFQLCGDQTYFSSFFPINQAVLSSWMPFKVEQRTIPVKIRRLDEVLPQLVAQIESPRIFLKMDTQGFDSQVVDGASGCLEQIVGMQSEISVIPLYIGIPHYTESLAQYERLGFELMNMFAVNRMRDGRILEYDCLMVRPTALRGSWPP